MSEQTSGAPCPYSFWEFSGDNSMKNSQNILAQAADVILLFLPWLMSWHTRLYVPSKTCKSSPTHLWLFLLITGDILNGKKILNKQVWNWKEGEWTRNILAQASVGTVLQVADFFLKWWSASLRDEEAEPRRQGRKWFLQSIKNVR